MHLLPSTYRALLSTFFMIHTSKSSSRFFEPQNVGRLFSCRIWIRRPWLARSTRSTRRTCGTCSWSSTWDTGRWPHFGTALTALTSLLPDFPGCFARGDLWHLLRIHRCAPVPRIPWLRSFGRCHGLGASGHMGVDVCSGVGLPHQLVIACLAQVMLTQAAVESP